MIKNIILLSIILSFTVTCYKLNNARVTFVLGAPASGKSTQCSKVNDNFCDVISSIIYFILI